jgi:hypothetical protein
MGVYQSLLDVPKYEMKLTEGGVAYKTTAQLLGGMYFDFDKTAALGLSGDLDGGVFSDQLGRSILVVWAKTSIDNSEEAKGIFTRKGEWLNQNLVVANWDYAQTKSLSPITSNEIELTGAPVFIFIPETKDVMRPSKAIDIIQGIGHAKITVNYNIKVDGFVDIDLINRSGKRIKSIVDQEEVRRGIYNVQFSKNGIKPGVYFVRMIIGQEIYSEKIVIQ